MCHLRVVVEGVECDCETMRIQMVTLLANRPANPIYTPRCNGVCPLISAACERAYVAELEERLQRLCLSYDEAPNCTKRGEDK